MKLLEDRVSLTMSNQFHNETNLFCKVCTFSTKYGKSLKRHVERMHLLIPKPLGHILECNQCDKKYRERGELNRHIKVKHEGFRIPCNFCEYQATGRSSINSHVKAIHQGVVHPCDHCEKYFRHSSDLSKHIKTNHNL